MFATSTNPSEKVLPSSFESYLTAKAVKDDVFKHKLIQDPKLVISNEFDVVIPENVQLMVFEDSPNSLRFELGTWEKDFSLFTSEDFGVDIDTRGADCSNPTTVCNQCQTRTKCVEDLF